MTDCTRCREVRRRARAAVTRVKQMVKPDKPRTVKKPIM